MLIAYTALGLARGGWADWATKKLSWQMAQNLSLQLLQRPPEGSIYLKFASPGMLPSRVRVQLNCHLPTHQTIRVPKHAASASPLALCTWRRRETHLSRVPWPCWRNDLASLQPLLFEIRVCCLHSLLLYQRQLIMEERWFLSWLLKQNELWRPFQSTNKLGYSAG